LRAGVRAAGSAMAVREAAEAAGDGWGSMMLATLTGKTKTRRVTRTVSGSGDEVGQMMVGVQVVDVLARRYFGDAWEVPQVRGFAAEVAGLSAGMPRLRMLRRR